MSKRPLRNHDDKAFAAPSYADARAVSAALKAVARNEAIKAYIERDKMLYRTLLRAAGRFIAGETLEACIETAKITNGQGHAVTIDFMGESTRDEGVAREATREFLRVVEATAAHRLDSSVSLDLSHIGVAIDPQLAFENALTIAKEADKAGLELMISMEESERTAVILELHGKLCERVANVGITLQAHLHRTPQDLQTVLERPGRIRLVKGAFAEPSTIAYDDRTRVTEAYSELMTTLLRSHYPCSIATHDPTLLQQADAFFHNERIESSHCEFEMLKGVTPERLGAMRELGYRTRVYLPYGTEWYLYLCHRLAEYPPNLYQAVVDMIGKEA